MINLLNLALPIVGIVHTNVTVTCRRYAGSALNDMGVAVPKWEEFTAYGQVQSQAVSDTKNQMNLDVAGQKLNIWIQAELHTVDTQEMADQVVYDGKVWNVMTLTNWMSGNGWGNYIVSEDKHIDAETGKPKGEETGGKDGLVW